MIGSLQCVVLDCPDVAELAHFYKALLGGVVDKPDRRSAVNDDFATLLHADTRGWRIFADPAGHPFCLLRGSS